MWGGLGAQLRLGMLGLAGNRAVRREPVAARPVVPPAPRPGDRAAGPPVRPAGRDLGTVGGERLRIELTGQGATGAAEERGSRVADALDVALADLRHAWDHGLARALGVEPSAAESNPDPHAPDRPAPSGRAD